MQRRQEPATKNKNRATGFSDADWGALEKRLSDTRDLLQDILLHLRRVLDNLKTVGDSYQAAGRAWRRTDSAAGAGRAQGTRASGAAGHADTRKSASGQKAHAGPGASSAAGATGNGARFHAAGSKASGASASQGSPGAAGRQTHFGSAGNGSTSSAGAAGSAGGQRFAGTAGASGARASQDRQAGNGFSWSSRTRTDSASSSSSFTGGSQQQQRASSQDWRAQREARAGSGAGERTDTRAGSRDSFGSQSRQERAGGQSGGQSSSQSGQQSHNKGHQQGHRTTGAGGGSSYQDYRQRTHKSPLGSGRMTLTQACALLCIVYPCTADDIKSAYRKQARRHHPDLGGNEEMMKSINQAYELALSWCSPLRGKSATWAA